MLPQIEDFKYTMMSKDGRYLPRSLRGSGRNIHEAMFFSTEEEVVEYCHPKRVNETMTLKGGAKVVKVTFVISV